MKIQRLWRRVPMKKDNGFQRKPHRVEYLFWSNDVQDRLARGYILKRALGVKDAYSASHRWTLYAPDGRRVARGKTLRAVAARWVEKRLEGGKG